MDLTTTLKKKPSGVNKNLVKATFILLACITVLLGAGSIKTEPTIDFKDIRTSQVKQGNFQVNVAGYGRLKAKYQRLLTSQAPAIVESISLYPGAKVNKDSIIMR